MKKLTAGIFTALLGLVTVNAANAAIPSTKYVTDVVNEVYDAYRSADNVTLNSAKDYTDQQVGTLTDLTTTAKGNTVAAINEVNSAYKAADTNLVNTKIGTDAMGDIQTGKEVTDVVKPTTLTQAVNALNAKIDFKTNGIATDENLQALQNTVNGHGTDISGLQGRMTAAEEDIDDLQGDVQTLTDADATNLQAAKDYADGLGSKYDAAGAAAAAQEAAEAAAATYTDGQIDALAAIYETKTNVSTAVQGAKDFASDKATEAGNDAKAYAEEKLELKVDKAQGAEKANHVVITDTNGDVTTSATITQRQVSGLTDALNGKMPLTTTDSANIGEDGTYVLTATTTGGVTTYKWEQIERVGTTPK